MMGRSSKPRKAYNPDRRRLHVPMHAETRNSIALELHVATESMIANPGADAADTLAKMLATMVTAIDYGSSTNIQLRQDADAMAVKEAAATLTSVEARFDRVGRYGMTGDEINTLRRAAGGLDKALSRIPYNVFQAGVAMVGRLAA